MEYEIKVNHNNGELSTTFVGVANDPESRKRIAAALRIIADRVDPERLNWQVQVTWSN